ncbi:MAG: aspartyl/glutamyl-tRNA amidotransferase subunit C [Bacilli bacterium]|nr:aspartyl/glutamyl-tRNA amidotransferase subunit C [Bacilli bacterium]
MKEINKDVLVDASNRLLFKMEDSEYETLLSEFDVIQKQFEIMGHIEGVDEAKPMTFPYDIRIDYLRDDVPSTPLAKEDVLKNAGSVKDGQIKLPKVV